MYIFKQFYPQHLFIFTILPTKFFIFLLVSPLEMVSPGAAAPSVPASRRHCVDEDLRLITTRLFFSYGTYTDHGSILFIVSV